MSFLSKLKRDFLAAMPVLGPHGGIEAELLLAGKKPIGWLTVYADNEILTDAGLRKARHDVKILDQAVAEGKLKSLDVISPETNQYPERILRHYCQPHLEPEMQLIADIHEKEFRGEPLPALTDNRDYGDFLGYRKRDILLFNNYQSLPKIFMVFMANINAAAQTAYQTKMLESCGINHNEWIERLRAEHILE